MRTDHRKRSTQYAIKFGIASVSLLLSLALLEVGLRLAGQYVESSIKRELPDYNTDTHYEIYGSNAQETSSKNVEILCIGDSFTNGGNVFGRWTENYPYHLSKLPAIASGPYRILNMGLCEDTTLGVYSRLVEFLQSSRVKHELPRYVVILAGSADAFHLKAEESPENLTWIAPEQQLDVLDKSWFFKMRIYKVYRHLKDEISRRYLLAFSEKRHTTYIWDRADEYIRETQSGSLQKASLVLKQSISFIQNQIEPKDRLGKDFYLLRDLLEPIVVAINRANLETNLYDRALEELLEVTKSIPEAWGVYGVRFLTFQVFRKQSKYSADSVLKLLESSGEVMKWEDVKLFHEHFKRFSKGEKAIEIAQIKLWGNLVELSKQYGFTLVIQNYPSDYRSVNESINKIARIYNLPLVDNRSLFRALIQRDGRQPYLLGDDHCTNLGYKLMAENVGKTISKLYKQK